MTDTTELVQYLTFTLDTGEKWGVPVDIIARHRAKHYAKEFDDSVERSLEEDTLPLFASDPYEVHDWATGDMDWEDVADHAVKLADAGPVDMQTAWIITTKEVEELPRQAALSREGMVLVPREPTEEMIAAGWRGFQGSGRGTTAIWHAYRAMIAAASASQTQDGE